MMNPTELNRLTIFDASRLLKNGEITPVELVKACLTRIEQFDDRIKSFITLTPERALKQAAVVEGEFRNDPEAASQSNRPLLGIPIAYKDLYETAGTITTAGSTFFKDYVPDQDCFVVQNLRRAGAISLGKLNMHEIALGVTNANPHYGICRNPWSFERIPGGSSGGSAAALAAGMIFGSMGSDTGGSIRIPSSLCGTVGLKPTYGLISLKGVIPLSFSLDHAGPMARNVRDTALLFASVSKYDPLDPYSKYRSSQNQIEKISGGVEGWRVAIAEDDFFSRSDPEIKDAVDNAGLKFEELGARVEKVPLPGARNAALSNGLITVCEAAEFHNQRMRDTPEGFGLDVLERLQQGDGYSMDEYIQARKKQAALRRSFENFFGEYDLLLTPTTPVSAPLIEGPNAVKQARLLTRYTAPFNLTGLPAVSLPCGFTPSGMPIGLQIISRPWGENTLLQAAYSYEQASDLSNKVPVGLEHLSKFSKS